MCKTIQQKVKIKAPPLKVYELLVNPEQHRAFTGQIASHHPKEGGRFSSYKNSITGINVELIPGKRIVQAWRERHFPEGIFSMVTLNLLPTSNGGTEIKLTHRGVPKDLIPRIESGWRTLYWEKMKRYFVQQQSGR